MEALAGSALDDLEECLTSGMLTSGAGSVAFRHELARLAVEESLPPNRRVDLHRIAVAALADPPAGAPDLARLVHHADAAGDAQAVLRFAPTAAARAASLGAHREAAAQYKRALRFADGKPSQAELLDHYSYECYLTDQFGEAIEAGERALDCYRRLGLSRKEGKALRSLSTFLWCAGRNVEAGQVGREAVVLLEQLEPGFDLAMAYSNLSRLYMNAEDSEGTMVWGTRALELAERLDETEIQIHTLNNVGTMELLLGQTEGKEKLERSIELARHAGLDENVGRAFVNMAWAAARTRSYDLADWVASGIEYCTERDVYLWRLYLVALQAHLDLGQGRWSQAADAVTFVLRDPRDAPLLRILALSVLGLVRVRRGDPGTWPPLDEAWALAEHSGELQRIAPVAAARGEAAWLEGRNKAVAQATEAALDLAVRCSASWVIGELAFWRWRSGIQEEIPPGAPEPYALQIGGDWRRAAELWTQIGCPYEAALALADADDDDDALRRALETLQGLGAAPAAAIVSQRLRDRGVRRLPRGPRSATRQNPANLTPRELDVLALVTEGLSNSEIAQRLSVSAKTVDHHVSAILRKLGVSTRRQAGAEAVRLGVATKDR